MDSDLISHMKNYIITFSKASKFFQCYCSTETSSFQVCIKVPVGELIKGTTMNENEFTTQQKKLTGMTESTVMCTIKPSLMDNDQSLLDCVLQTAFMNRSPSPAAKDLDTKIYRFAPLLFYWLNFTFHMRRNDLLAEEADSAEELTDSMTRGVFRTLSNMYDDDFCQNS